MDIVMIRQEMLLLTPGTKWTLPDEVCQELIDRGAAEPIGEMPDAATKKMEKKKGGAA